jgi:hypothetical protein
LQKEDGWNQIEQVHPELYAQYEDRIDSVTKEKVREMYKEDQSILENSQSTLSNQIISLLTIINYGVKTKYKT